MAEAVLSKRARRRDGDDSAETPRRVRCGGCCAARAPCSGLFVIALLVAFGVAGAADLALRSDLADLDGGAQGAVGLHWFGTDDVGRDVLARVIYGARASLMAGVISVAIAIRGRRAGRA